MQYKTLQGYYSGHITEGCYHCIEAKNELYFFLHTRSSTELYSIAAWSIRCTPQYGANWYKMKTSNQPPFVLRSIPFCHSPFFHYSNPCRPLAVSGDAYTSV